MEPAPSWILGKFIFADPRWELLTAFSSMSLSFIPEAKPLLVLRQPHIPLYTEGVFASASSLGPERSFWKNTATGAREELSQKLPDSLREEKYIYQG